MIHKLTLQSIINKYYLNGLIESVKWDITNYNLSINFVSPNKDMMGFLTHTEFPLDNVLLPIFSTSQLNKIIGITSGDLLLALPSPNRLHISDSNFEVEYALADPIIIPQTGNVTEPPTYEVKLELDNENIDNLIKAKNAFPSDEDLVMLKTKINNNKQHVLEFTFGENSNHSNKIKYEIECEIEGEVKKSIPFNSNCLRDILVANKTADKAVIYMYERGLLKLYFESLNTTTTYYMVRRSDS